MPKLRELDADERMVVTFLTLCGENLAPLGVDPSVDGFDEDEYLMIRTEKEARMREADSIANPRDAEPYDRTVSLAKYLG